MRKPKHIKTRIIGIKEFRQNISKISKESRKKPIRLVVMNHMTPVFRVESIDEDFEDALLAEKFAAQIEQGFRDIKAGRTFSLEEVMAHIRRKK